VLLCVFSCSARHGSFWLLSATDWSKGCTILGGGQEIVRVTLLVSLRGDSMHRGEDSPRLLFVIVYSTFNVGSNRTSIVFLYPILTTFLLSPYHPQSAVD
jgi:hypothetical protein